MRQILNRVQVHKPSRSPLCFSKNLLQQNSFHECSAHNSKQETTTLRNFTTSPSSRAWKPTHCSSAARQWEKAAGPQVKSAGEARVLLVTAHKAQFCKNPGSVSGSERVLSLLSISSWYKTFLSCRQRAPRPHNKRKKPQHWRCCSVSRRTRWTAACWRSRSVSLQPNLIQNKLQTKPQKHTPPPVVPSQSLGLRSLTAPRYSHLLPQTHQRSIKLPHPDSDRTGSDSPSFRIQSDGPRLVQLLPEQHFPQSPVQLRHLDPIGLRVCPVKFTP